MIPCDRVSHLRGRAFPTTRVLSRVREAIERYALDLGSTVVLTEAATGYYRITPVLAALAGAQEVLAVARSSAFGTADDAKAQVEDLAAAAGVERRLTITETPAHRLADRAQIITNLGAVRPIDSPFIAVLSSQAVVSLMFGADDARPADLDVKALRSAKVPLCGVDEERIGLFRWTGQRIAWWLTEVGIEIVGSRLVIWGDGPPARAAARWLAGAGAHITRLSEAPKDTDLAGIDGLLLMDRQAHVEPRGAVRPDVIAQVAPGAVILEYAGVADRASCGDAGLLVYPLTAARDGHVARTVGEILYAPIIELHTAGLKVGELMARARQRGLDAAECEDIACRQGPGERVP